MFVRESWVAGRRRKRLKIAASELPCPSIGLAGTGRISHGEAKRSILRSMEPYWQPETVSGVAPEGRSPELER